MAITAASFTNVEKYGIAPGLSLVMGTFTGPASYASGGEAITDAIVASWGITKIKNLRFTPLVKASDGTQVNIAFDHNVSGTTQGKIRAQGGGVGAHTHDFLLIGGQSAATHTHDMKIIGGQGAAGTNTVTAPAATDILGKEEAGDADILGADVATKGGVVANSTPTAILMVGTDTIGKAEAANRTIVGSASATKGGVVATTAGTTDAELTAATDLSTYTCRFECWGS